MNRLVPITLRCVGLVACGSDTPSADETPREAADLARQTRELAEDVARTGQQVVEDPAAAEDELPAGAERDLDALRDDLPGELP